MVLRKIHRLVMSFSLRGIAGGSSGASYVGNSCNSCDPRGSMLSTRPSVEGRFSVSTQTLMGVARRKLSRGGLIRVAYPSQAAVGSAVTVRERGSDSTFYAIILGRWSAEGRSAMVTATLSKRRASEGGQEYTAVSQALRGARYVKSRKARRTR